MEYKFAIKIGDVRSLILGKAGTFVISEDSSNHMIKAKFNESEFALGSRVRHLELAPSEYGLKIYGSVYDKDIVKFVDKSGCEHIGVATLNDCLNDFRREPGVIDNDVFYAFKEIHSVEVLSSTLVDDIEDFAGEEVPVVSPVTIYVRSISRNSMCGYGIIIEKDNEIIKEASVKLGNGSNNYAELKAVYDGIRKVVSEYNPSYLVVKASEYIINGATKWYKGWIKNDWMTQAKKPVINSELWKKIIDLNRNHNIKYEIIDEKYEERLVFLANDCFNE